MAPFRLPEKHLPMFKALCNVTIENLHLPKLLIGLKAYSPFCKALGHRDFNALKQDSKQYQEGHFDWNAFLDRILKYPFHEFKDGEVSIYLALSEATQELHKAFPIITASIFINAMDDKARLKQLYKYAKPEEWDKEFLTIDYLSDDVEISPNRGFEENSQFDYMQLYRNIAVMTGDTTAAGLDSDRFLRDYNRRIISLAINIICWSQRYEALSDAQVGSLLIALLYSFDFMNVRLEEIFKNESIPAEIQQELKRLHNSFDQWEGEKYQKLNIGLIAKLQAHVPDRWLSVIADIDPHGHQLIYNLMLHKL